MKFNKDHIELFSGAIRSVGGCNNNPTAQQFTAVYKGLCYEPVLRVAKEIA